MSIIDDIRIRQRFDPTGENGGYKCTVETEHGQKPVGGYFLEVPMRWSEPLDVVVEVSPNGMIQTATYTYSVGEHGTRYANLEELARGEAEKKAAEHFTFIDYPDWAVDKEGWGG